jgi:hypothetical protein
MVVHVCNPSIGRLRHLGRFETSLSNMLRPVSKKKEREREKKKRTHDFSKGLCFK